MFVHLYTLHITHVYGAPVFLTECSYTVMCSRAPRQKFGARL
jgi:hypothetical protein